MKNEPVVFGNPTLCAVISSEEVIKITPNVRRRNFVYMLVKKKEIIYVGRTSDLRVRLFGWQRCREFDKVYLCEYLEHKENCSAERAYINYYKPKYNRR